MFKWFIIGFRTEEKNCKLYSISHASENCSLGYIHGIHLKKPKYAKNVFEGHITSNDIQVWSRNSSSYMWYMDINDNLTSGFFYIEVEIWKSYLGDPVCPSSVPSILSPISIHMFFKPLTAAISPINTWQILMKLRMEIPVLHAYFVWQPIEHRSTVKVIKNIKTTVLAITFETSDWL